MKIKKEIECSIAILTALGRNKKEKLSLNHLVDIIHFSKPFTKKTIIEILKAGYISSEMGPNGGYRLNVDPEKLTLKEIFSFMGDKDGFIQCYNSKKCIKGCIIDNSMRMLNERLNDVLKDITLKDFIEGG